MSALPPERRLLSGTEALVELLRAQRALDRAAGLDTAGFVSGYRGSPLGGVDFALWRERAALQRDGIRFEPGLNEELAATAMWGTQQLHRFGGARHAGVFALWYGKNPGLDRIGDVLKHANQEGTAALGGVLAATGDDPAASSSTIANQGEQAFIAAMAPVLYPADVADLLALGLAGFALSRYCGLWVGFKLVADVVESTRSVALGGHAPLRLPADFELPPGGLNCRVPDDRWAQDERTLRYRLPAARAFARANGLDRSAVMPEGRRLIGFVAAGKAWGDLREAFALLGLQADELARHGVGLRRIALVWPLEDRANAEFARGFAEVCVVEEKRAVIEPQLAQLAYPWPAGLRPRLSGKRTPEGAELLPEHGELDPLLVARAVLARLAAVQAFPPERLQALAARLDARSPAAAATIGPKRTPHFCAGCPHARSTRLPEGSQALAGIGCHSMAMWMPDSHTSTLCQMGGEGANWIGAASFVDLPHVFQNLGDGTYMHSGLLAIRAAVAAGTPITYKILVNETVAMTGGQPVEGAPDAGRIVRQLHAEGVQRIALLTGPGAAFDGSREALPPGVWRADRDELDAVMRAFREFRGVSAIVYDQICATEKRRMRKRGTRFAAEPVVLIHERICDGCGDCSLQSHCSAVRPLATPFGLKRRIDQSTCNTDLSCTDGFCPSFITIERAQGAAGAPPVAPPIAPPIAPPAEWLAVLPAPAAVALAGEQPFSVVLAGVGGSGLVTMGAIVAAAAFADGLAVSQLDNTGLARKGGEVTTHLRLARAAAVDGAARIPEAGADLLLAGDLAAAGAAGVVGRLAPGARAVIAADAVPMLEQALNPARPLPLAAYRAGLEARLGRDAIGYVDAEGIAQRALGDTLYANTVLLGVALQRGCLPVSVGAVEAAIRAHGSAVERNLAALAWGRLAAAQPAAVQARLEDASPDAAAAAGGDDAAPAAAFSDPAAAIAFFAAELVRYQGRALAARYRALVEGVVAAEQRAGATDAALALAAARHAFDVLAIKDEYEVARLATDPQFLQGLRQQYGRDARPVFHFAPTWLPSRATGDGRRRKHRFGPWIIAALRLLARLRGLRGSVFDPFRYQAERRAQRRFTQLYCSGLELIARALSPAQLALAREFVRLPEDVRGYGPIRMPRLQTATRQAQRLLDKLGSPRAAAGAQPPPPGA